MKHLIIKLFTDNISETEKEELLDWLQKEDNISILRNYIQHDYDLNKAMLKPDINRAYESLMKHIGSSEYPKGLSEKTKPVVSIFKRSWFKYVAAATVVSVLASSYFLRNALESQDTKPGIVNNIIKPGDDKAILTLNDGTQVVLEKGKTYQDQNVNSNGVQLRYGAADNTNKEIAFNFLTVPRGGQFFLKLSDGTQIWLNSDSKLKYPVRFVAGESRKVELLYGEAYFDVSPSTENKGSSFIVNNQLQDIEVLGTEFNVKAYKDDAKVYTTLVEGKVSVNNAADKKVLKPNQQTIVTSNNQSIELLDVSVYPEIAWKDGVFNFRERELKDVMAVLARWYDIDIVIQDNELQHQKFNGLLRKNQDLEHILKLINQTQNITYEKKENKIILKK